METSDTWYSTSTRWPDYTIRYTTSDGTMIYKTYDGKSRTKLYRQDPDLDAGDTTALDSFLGDFSNAK